MKYAPENGWVAVRARVLDDGRVELLVRDTGVDMPRADLPRSTERFYRADQARGELLIESEQGEGTTVRVVLPGAGGATVAAPMPLPMPGV